MDFKKKHLLRTVTKPQKKIFCLLIFVWNIVQTVKEYANLGRNLTDNGRKFRESIRLWMVTYDTSFIHLLGLQIICNILQVMKIYR